MSEAAVKPDKDVCKKTVVHRRAEPAQGLTFDSLFAAYQTGNRRNSLHGWPTDDMVGAEFESWMR